MAAGAAISEKNGGAVCGQKRRSRRPGSKRSRASGAGGANLRSSGSLEAAKNKAVVARGHGVRARSFAGRRTVERKCASAGRRRGNAGERRAVAPRGHGANSAAGRGRSGGRPVPRLSEEERAASKYKTELCNAWEERGWCRYGERCQFAHGAAELRAVERHPQYKSRPCRAFWTDGLCTYGPRCKFAHAPRSGGGAHDDAIVRVPPALRVSSGPLLAELIDPDRIPPPAALIRAALPSPTPSALPPRIAAFLEHDAVLRAYGPPVDLRPAA